jgi:hypothetical protein
MVIFLSTNSKTQKLISPGRVLAHLRNIQRTEQAGGNQLACLHMPRTKQSSGIFCIHRNLPRIVPTAATAQAA